ncbi:hypothetical protein CROQUDRAFT_689777 [Cronartium quercuum f. sp. fusiforme G11]|uniref:Uncharacterized protein n=1 Tax=Cronartium quercuum f. sp. fusiforme G11 TaxID=708437 RepID=A0A9P6T6A5_9BASI|nr:hypothetical protein CROQUDRAFT_689777 [Cronartium quercuum f. sp. fusiforme G11]
MDFGCATFHDRNLNGQDILEFVQDWKHLSHILYEMVTGKEFEIRGNKDDDNRGPFFSESLDIDYWCITILSPGPQALMRLGQH